MLLDDDVVLAGVDLARDHEACLLAQIFDGQCRGLPLESDCRPNAGKNFRFGQGGPSDVAPGTRRLWIAICRSRSGSVCLTMAMRLQKRH
jgi:hypothetical protein